MYDSVVSVNELVSHDYADPRWICQLLHEMH